MVGCDLVIARVRAVVDCWKISYQMKANVVFIIYE